MKKLFMIALLGLSPAMLSAQQSDMQMGHAEKPATLMSGLGSQHHPVSTTNTEAQRFRSLFGLTQILKAQKKDFAAALVQQQFESAWKNADTNLKLEDLSQ